MAFGVTTWLQEVNMSELNRSKLLKSLGNLASEALDGYNRIESFRLESNAAMGESIAQALMTLGTVGLAQLKKIRHPVEPSSEGMPKWLTLISEEYRANLIDLRVQWYGDRPLNWRTHLRVKVLTLRFLIIELGWFQLSYRVQQRFSPIRRPRL
jgi:hypothetical protein